MSRSDTHRTRVCPTDAVPAAKEASERPAGHSARPSLGPALRVLVLRGVPPVLAAVALLIVWSLVVRIWSIQSFLVPPPSQVFQRLWLDRGLLLSAWWRTGQAAVAGLLLSLLAGTLVGVLFSQWALLRFAFYPYAIFLQTVPIVAIAPLLVMWLGYGAQGVVAVAFVLSFFPLVASVTAGMLAVQRPLRELFQLYRASRWQTLCKLQFPFAIPYLVTGLKTSSGLSVIGAIVGEFFVGYGGKGFGLGYLIRSSAESYQTASLFAAIILSTLLGVAVFASVSLLSEWALKRWGHA
jgi:NitT/TauT family transport system permease protein